MLPQLQPTSAEGLRVSRPKTNSGGIGNEAAPVHSRTLRDSILPARRRLRRRARVLAVSGSQLSRTGAQPCGGIADRLERRTLKRYRCKTAVLFPSAYAD